MLDLLGVSEQALLEVPSADDDRRAKVSLELTDVERVWLEQVSVALGLSAASTASRTARLVVRALIRNRDLLPVSVSFDSSTQPWLAELEAEPRPLAARLGPWADALPDETVRQIIELLEASLRRRG